MATSNVRISIKSAIDNTTASGLEKKPNFWSTYDHVINFIAQAMSGAKGRPGALEIRIDENSTQATGTVTCDGSTANNVTVNVGQTTFTAKTGTPSGSTQWKAGVSANADGAALAAIINAHPTASKYFSAANSSGTVTITAIGYLSGTLGNGAILTSSDATHTAAVAFSGGVDDSTLASFTY